VQEICEGGVAVRRQNDLVVLRPDYHPHQSYEYVQRGVELQTFFFLLETWGRHRTYPVDDVGDRLAMMLHSASALPKLFVLAVVDHQN
jgi:hypothetical protein